MAKLVVCSDVHIDTVTCGVERFDDIEKLVNQTVLYAIEEKADAWLHCGDWCDPDNKRTLRSITALADICEDLTRNGVVPILLAGNHCTVEDGQGTTVLSPLKHQGFVVEKPCVKMVDDQNIMFLPYPSRCSEYDPPQYVTQIGEAGQPVDAIFGHLNIQGVEAGSEAGEFARGKEVFFPHDEVKKYFPKAKLFNGHYHKRQNFKGIQIVGSLAQLSFGEEHHNPGFLVVDV